MNVKRRSGDMNNVPTMTIKNAVSQRKDGPTQAAKIKNTISSPKAQGVAKIKGAVNGPGGKR